MSGDLTVPAGFTVVTRDTSTLIADIARLPDLQRCALDRPDGWSARLHDAGDGAGRGATARLELSPGRTIVLKQLRRGGLAGPLWQDRYAGKGRPLENLRVPIEARRRGVPTPAPVALMLEPGGLETVRAWLAVEEVRDAADLAARFRSDAPPEPAELAEVMTTVREMHDQGVEHRDLNLGNLMVCRDPESRPRVHVIDLDAARLHDPPLPFPLRQRALRRLERSSCKLGLGGADSAEVRAQYYALYAGGDVDLAARLERGRPVGRMLIRLHALRWGKSRLKVS